MPAASPLENIVPDSRPAAATKTPPCDPHEAPPIDIAYLDRQTFGDVALRQELLGVFAEQVPLLVARIVPPFGDDARLSLHTLKGAARAVGAGPLAAAAAALEEALRLGDPWQPALKEVATTAQAACACAGRDVRDRP